MKLGQIAEIKSGSTPLRTEYERYFKDGTIPWVKTMDLNNGFICSTNESITLAAISETSCKIFPAGTILVAMYGGFNQIGRTGLLKIDSAVNQAISAINLNKDIALPEYVLQFLNARVSYWKKFAASSRKDPNITRNDVCDFPIILPPIEEQRKIAEILGTWDSAIALTEKLVTAKKKYRKLLESLLFKKSTQWEKFKLGELIEIKHGYAFSSDYFSEKETDKILLTPGNFHVDGHLYFGNKTKYYVGKTNDEFHLKNGDLLIVMTDLTKDMNILGNTIILESKKIVLHNQRIGKIIIKHDYKVDKKFLCHLLNSKLCKKHIKGTATGSTVRHTSSKEILKTKVSIPSIKMQKIISNVLDTADYEIQTFNRYCDLLKTQKRGLMQKLLTGEWRVKIEKGNS